jgi:hypothetical protein
MKKAITALVALLCLAGISNAQKVEKSLEMYGGAGINDFTKFSLGADFVFSYNLNDYVALAASWGCRYTGFAQGAGDAASGMSSWLIPIRGRIKINLTKEGQIPYMLLDAGWAYDFDWRKSLLLLEPGFGVRVNDKFNIAVCANIHQAKYIKNYSSSTQWGFVFGSKTVEGWACTVCLKLGYIF